MAKQIDCYTLRLCVTIQMYSLQWNPIKVVYAMRGMLSLSQITEDFHIQLPWCRAGNYNEGQKRVARGRFFPMSEFLFKRHWACHAQSPNVYGACSKHKQEDESIFCAMIDKKWPIKCSPIQSIFSLQFSLQCRQFTVQIFQNAQSHHT